MTLRSLFFGAALLALPHAALAGPPVRFVKDLYPGGDGFPVQFARVGDVTLFKAANDFGEEMWRTDGTEQGTFRVTDIEPGGGDGAPLFWNFGPVRLGSFVLFAGEESEHGAELWRTDGTEAGTWLVEDIMPGPIGTGTWFSRHAVRDGVVYFMSSDDEVSRQLWRSDGTAEGTFRLTTTPNNPSPPYLAMDVLGDRVIFLKSRGHELWTTDGTVAGTQRIRQFPQIDPLFPVFWEMRTSGSITYFGTEEVGTGPELWRTDGTPEGTFLVKDVNPGPASSEIKLLEPLGRGNRVVFFADDGVHGVEPWVSSGTPESTRLLKDLRPGPASSWPQSITAPSVQAGGLVYFAANDGEHGMELFVTDGSPEGTRLLVDARPGPQSGIMGAAWLMEAGGDVFFTASDGVHGKELWTSDGTPKGTRMLADLQAGPGSSDVTKPILSGSTIFLAALGGPGEGHELWAVDLPSVSVQDVVVSEGAGVASFALTVTDPNDGPVVVHYETVDGTARAGSDYQHVTGDLVIPAGATSAVLQVPLRQDRVPEETERFSVRLSRSRHGVIGRAAAVASVADDEVAGR
ncbi:MAG: Calx-beta domain-containing protein [Vicinamibacteria bacterium]